MKFRHKLGSIALILFFAVYAFDTTEAAPSSAPYQAYRYTHCGPLNGPLVDCLINFPTVGVNRRIELSHISCYVQGGGILSLDFVEIIVVSAQGLPLAAVTLQVTQTGETGNSDPMNVTRSFSALAGASIYSAAGTHFQADARSLRGFISMLACNLDGRSLTLH